jgi:hypothetical protein
LSHEHVEEGNVQYTPVYNEEIVADRRDILAPNGKSLWCFANLYFNARNPMLYRVIIEKPIDDIVVLAVKPSILNKPDIFITTGNARAWHTEILPQSEGLRVIRQIRHSVDIEWWKEEDGSKRKIMAECLVPDLVPPEYIQAVYVANHQIAKNVRAMLRPSEIPVIPEPHMFFRPLWASKLTPNLSLVDGDMFFSKMQTLTISVNCVGVMGKGLASRVRYQFPGVYVIYQDLCRSGKLKMGKPYLLKKELELSLDYELADEPASLTNAKLGNWFLLFPTKKHWRERADIQGIEAGLLEVQKDYKRFGIESLAVPALGCGLGWLKWRNVGPLLCRYLSMLDIPVDIYLPREEKLSEELLSKQFLLGSEVTQPAQLAT